MLPVRFIQGVLFGPYCVRQMQHAFYSVFFFVQLWSDSVPLRVNELTLLFYTPHASQKLRTYNLKTYQ
jgi:hypothetical protein